jgi:CRISPR-associated protein Cmr3
MTAQLWKFEAMDTWFFRESRPFDTIGGTQLKSTFPPPARTIVGAIRTAIGEANGVDWHQYQNGNEYESLRRSMGDAHGLGQLDFSGPFLMKDGNRLYPAPLLLLRNENELYRLSPGEKPVHCDLGTVRLPILDNAERGAKPLEGCWLTHTGLQKVLSGNVPGENDIYQHKDLASAEDRLGIGRDNNSRTNIDTLLYQTRHIRPHEDIAVGIRLDGLDDIFSVNLREGINKLGGEGRFGAFEIIPAQKESFDVTTPNNNTKVLLMLLTAGDFDGGWIPLGFQRATQDGCDVWCGEIKGVSLRIVSAITGKPVREGGWDVANRTSRPLRSLAPAGSCYFCEVINGSAQDAIDQLQGCKIGEDTQIGRGELAVGCW